MGTCLGRAHPDGLGIRNLGWDGGEGLPLLCWEPSLTHSPQQGQGPSLGTGDWPQPSEPHQPMLGGTWRRGRGGGRTGRPSRGRVLTTASKFIFPVSQQQHCLMPALCVSGHSPLPASLPSLTTLSWFNQLCLSPSFHVSILLCSLAAFTVCPLRCVPTPTIPGLSPRPAAPAPGLGVQLGLGGCQLFWAQDWDPISKLEVSLEPSVQPMVGCSQGTTSPWSRGIILV